MRRRSFLTNNRGVSLMYDAVLFLIMVSLAGVLLLPALRSNIAIESSVENHREHVVDDVLHTFLVSRADSFDYTFCGTVIDDVARDIGINTSSDGLYAALTHWLLAHEQRHKTYATLLAEDLACQFQLPCSFLGIHRLNLFTGDYDRQLKNETQRFFSHHFSGKYRFNFTAWWHPIKAIPFGGEFSVGEHPPTKDTYVARSSIMIPYSPVLTIGNHTIIFTKQWLKHQLFNDDVGFGRSSIPALANMMMIFENYTNQDPPYDVRENASKAVKENLSAVVYGFLIDGIENETNVTVFPGIVNITLSYGFEKIKNIIKGLLSDGLNETFGAAIRTIDTLFSTLNTSVDNPLSEWILSLFNGTIQGMLNQSFGSLDDAFNALERTIKEKITILLTSFLDQYIEAFVNFVFDVFDSIIDFAEMLMDWLFDQIDLNTAETSLTIWVVKE